MKHIFRIIIYILIVIETYSCNVSNKKNENYHFPTSRMLEGNYINKPQLKQARSINIIDSILVIVNRKGEYFFEFYDNNDFNLLGLYGMKGRGPGEFVSPIPTGEFYKNSNDMIIIEVYDWIRRRLNFINLHESIANESYVCKSERLPNDIQNAYKIIFNNDSLMGIVPDLDGESRFIIYDKVKNEMKHTPFKPEIARGGVHKNNLYYMYATAGNCVSSSKQYFIVAPNGNGQMDYFDFKGNYLKSIHLKDNNFLKNAKQAKDVQLIDGFNVFYSDMKIVKNEVYALFTVIQLPNLNAISKSKIYVFDLDGNPLREYILDKEIHKFAVDPVNKRFIGFNTEGKNNYQLINFNFD